MPLQNEFQCKHSRNVVQCDYQGYFREPKESYEAFHSITIDHQYRKTALTKLLGIQTGKFFTLNQNAHKSSFSSQTILQRYLRKLRMWLKWKSGSLKVNTRRIGGGMSAGQKKVTVKQRSVKEEYCENQQRKQRRQMEVCVCVDTSAMWGILRKNGP